MAGVQECRLKLYRTVASALKDGRGDDRGYGKILSQLQALLDSEAVESGEEVSSAIQGSLGSAAGENFHKLIETELKRTHKAEAAARCEASRLRKENGKLSDEVEKAKHCANAAMEECRRFRKEAKMNKAIIHSFGKGGKAPDDGALCRQLQEKVTKHKAESTRLKQHLSIAQERIAELEKDYKQLKAEADAAHSKLRDELESAQTETGKLRVAVSAQKEAVSAAEKRASEFKTTISKLGEDAQAMFKNERKLKASTEKTHVEMVKWQHAAENAARVAEQAKEQVQNCLKGRKALESEVEQWKLRANTLDAEAKRIRAESKTLAETSEERLLILSWMEKSVLHPVCEYSLMMPAPSATKGPTGGPPSTPWGSFALAQWAYQNCQWVNQACVQLVDAAKSNREVLNESHNAWQEKIQALEEECQFKVEKLSDKLKDAVEEKSLAVEQIKAEEKKCGRLREDKRKLNRDIENLKTQLSDLRSEITSIQHEAEKKIQCCSTALTDAVKSASESAFQNGLEVGRAGIEKLEQEKQAQEELCQQLQGELAELKRVELHMQGEKVELDAEISAAREQVFQLSEDLASLKSHWSDSRAKLNEAINAKDAECLKMEERARSLDILLRECECQNRELALQNTEQQTAIERWERGAQNSDARLEAVQRELELVTVERDEYRNTFSQISGNLAEKEDFVRDAKSRLVCVEGLLEEKDFLLKQMSDQVRELNHALEAKALEVAASDLAATEARECSQAAAQAVESNASTIKEMKQKLAGIEAKYEEKLLACRENSRMEVEDCQNKMRAQLEAAQIQLDVLRSQFSQMKRKMSAFQSDTASHRPTVDINVLDPNLFANLGQS